MAFATAVHKCACGCGREVVTPLSPTDWKLTFDGESISLHPSLGNWGFPCRSHYWIRNDRVSWAAKWSDEEIESGRARDRTNKARFYGEKSAATQRRSWTVLRADRRTRSLRPTLRPLRRRVTGSGRGCGAGGAAGSRCVARSEDREIPRGIDLGIDPMVYSPRASTPMDPVGLLAITLAFDLPHRVPRWSPMVAWCNILKTGDGVTHPRVRISSPPPESRAILIETERLAPGRRSTCRGCHSRRREGVFEGNSRRASGSG